MVTADVVESQYDEAVEKIIQSFHEFQREGGGWMMEEVMQLTLNVVTYLPLQGSSYINLLKKLKDKKNRFSI